MSLDELANEQYRQRTENIDTLTQTFRKQWLPPGFTERGTDAHHFVSQTHGKAVLQHWNHVMWMELFTKLDLAEIARIEHENAIKGPGDSAEHFRTEHVGHYVISRFENVLRTSHSYVARVSTWTDNLYYMIADYYRIDVEKIRKEKKGEKDRKSERRIIESELCNHNRRLRKHLKDTFGFCMTQKDFNEIRNAHFHDYWKLRVLPDVLNEDPLQKYGYIGKMFLDESQKEVRLFDYLFKLYNHMVSHSTKAWQLMLEVPRPEVKAETQAAEE